MVVKRADGKPLTSADQQKIGQAAQALQAKHFTNVTAVQTGPQALSQNHRVQVITVPLPTSWSDQKLEKKNEDGVKQLRLAATQEFRGSGLHYGVTGPISSTIDNAASDDKTMALIGMATIALIIILILAIFRAPLAALLPIVVIGLVLEVSNTGRRDHR